MPGVILALALVAVTTQQPPQVEASFALKTMQLFAAMSVGRQCSRARIPFGRVTRDRWIEQAATLLASAGPDQPPP